MKKPQIFDVERWDELTTMAKVRALSTAEKIEQRKLKLIRLELRLDKEKATIRAQERRADAHRKIKLGGLLIAAGLGDWDEAVLRGAFAAIRDTVDTNLLKAWRDDGGALYDEEIKNRAARPLVVALFSTQPSETVRVALRAQGMKWNADARRWEGRVALEPIQSIAAGAGGQAEQIAA